MPEAQNLNTLNTSSIQNTTQNTSMDGKALKRIEVRYKAEQIGIKAIERACRYYTNDVELTDILQFINAQRACNNTLNLADLYTILNHAAQAGKIVQRKKFLTHELEINQFVIVFRAWRNNMRPKEILTLIPGMEVGIERVVRSLNLRHRDFKNKLELKYEAAARDVLALSMPMMVQGRKAYVIFADQIPKELIDDGLELPSDDEDLLEDIAKTVPPDKPEVSTGNTPEQDKVCAIPLTDTPEVVRPSNGHIPPPRRVVPEEYEHMDGIQTEEEILASSVFDEVKPPAEEEPVIPKKSPSEAMDDFL